MTKRKFHPVFPLMAVCLLLLIGCAEKPPVEGVETVSAEQIREMIREAWESALAEESKLAAAESTEAVSSDTAVYWTDGGQVWHTDPACASLKRASTVRTGSIAEAEKAGKSRLCSYCQGK
ncbi:MAG: hypothetical protein E7654_06680 [Ruminococcaceae bacterium]|nr:hypothetical protein [Oscillospiraceae bacterium]